MTFYWKDTRYIAGNEDRAVNCNSNLVIWTEAGQFWLPKFLVWNVLELVIGEFQIQIANCYPTSICICMNSQIS